MNEAKVEKVRRFANDKVMSSVVYEVVLAQFLKPKSGPTEEKAARFIAIEQLQEAWKVLESFKNLEEKEPNQLKQVGL